MELILWRHAEAEDGADDMARRLTAKGEKQAAAMAQWLRGHLPGQYTLLASPAMRAQQTASALGTPITERSLAPGASVAVIVKAVERYRGVVIVVGHQPDLGRAAAHLVANARSEWSIDKGAVWWLAGDAPARIKAVVSADLL
jgi:phosphohistidine phosphatase